MKKFINKTILRGKEILQKSKSKILEQKGGSELVSVVILIIIVVVVAVVIFLPAITEFFKGMMTKLSTYTDKLFNFAG